MKKRYVLDTNVLIHDPRAIFSFEDNVVVIPLQVLEEIDNLKTRPGNVGRNAREVARNFDKLRSRGKLNEGIKLDKDGILMVSGGEDLASEVYPGLDPNKIDNQILALASKFVHRDISMPTILVSKDINLRLKADSIGVKAEDYETGKVQYKSLYTGVVEINLSSSDLHKLNEGGIPIESIEEKLKPNEFCILKTSAGKERYAIVKGKTILPLSVDPQKKFWGIKARNKEQLFAMQLLLDDDIKLVTLVGIAGTGKTLLAVMASLVKVVDEHRYKKMIIARPLIPMGKDIGYLPGSQEEKVRPWMQPIFDNLEFLLSNRKMKKSEFLKHKDLIEIEILSYIRGRSIPEQYIIIDEAQNLTPHEVKTIITRVGDNTKIVLTGDPTQIDNPYLNADDNGLTYAADKFINQPIAGNMVLTKGERSELATLASKLL
ncbi:MAG: PhoH family protein [Thermotogae bacterium]|nr:PhoH family protein [Thermotogota bacterium]